MFASLSNQTLTSFRSPFLKDQILVLVVVFKTHEHSDYSDVGLGDFLFVFFLIFCSFFFHESLEVCSRSI